MKMGYSLDQMFLLHQMNQQVDVKSLCKGSPKLEVLLHSLYRKGLVTDDYSITLIGKGLLEFIETGDNADGSEPVSIVKPKLSTDGFDDWWKAYPGTDNFVYKNKRFTGSRSLRVKKEDCKVKLNKIIQEGKYTIAEMVAALEYEVMQKKENSLKTSTNKLSFMQNSLTYLNQRTFEPFIELIREGAKLEETNGVTGGTDI